MQSQETARFPWRGWAICALNSGGGGRSLFADHVRRACERAADYGMNLLEFHDFACPGGIVDAVISYRHFKNLASPLTSSQRADHYRYFKDLAVRTRDRGLELNAWYHVFRDAPPDLTERYPEALNVDRPFVWDFIAHSIDEFFERLPEVNRLTITSLHETPSIMAAAGTLSRTERLIKLYRTIYDACRRHGKGLVLRDFMSHGGDLQTFWSILDRLPGDLILMTKEVLVDWRHIGLPLSPNLGRYAGRPFVVEMDIYGEYQGRASIPWCHPEYVHHAIRNLLPFRPLGITARILHDDRPPAPFRTVFETPNDVNLYALGTFLRDPGPELNADSRWHSDQGHMDAALWCAWTKKKYGTAAVRPVMRALRRTPQIIERIYDLAGTTYQHHSRYPSPAEAAGTHSFRVSWKPAVNIALDERLERIGIGVLRDEKLEALHLAKRSLHDIRSAADGLKPSDFRALCDLFEGTILFIRGLIAHLETWEASRLRSPGCPVADAREAFRKACRNARTVSRNMRRRFGDAFMGGTPDALDRLVDAARERERTLTGPHPQP